MAGIWKQLYKNGREGFIDIFKNPMIWLRKIDIYKKQNDEVWWLQMSDCWTNAELLLMGLCFHDDESNQSVTRFISYFGWMEKGPKESRP